nr:unnamed protein product [Digitaria exilis]
MGKAMKTTLVGTRHRWHVLKDAKKKLGNAYSKYGGFKKEFNKLVTDETCKRRFERSRRMLVEKYNLSENKFMSRLYK